MSERYLSVARVCDKLSRGKTWVYEAMKSDPTFPKAFYMGTAPMFVESQLDAWMLAKINAPPEQRRRVPMKAKAGS